MYNCNNGAENTLIIIYIYHAVQSDWQESDPKGKPRVWNSELYQMELLCAASCHMRVQLECDTTHKWGPLQIAVSHMSVGLHVLLSFMAYKWS